MRHQVSPPASAAMPACSSGATDANGLRDSKGQGLQISPPPLPGASHGPAQQRGACSAAPLTQPAAKILAVLPPITHPQQHLPNQHLSSHRAGAKRQAHRPTAMRAWGAAPQALPVTRGINSATAPTLTLSPHCTAQPHHTVRQTRPKQHSLQQRRAEPPAGGDANPNQQPSNRLHTQRGQASGIRVTCRCRQPAAPYPATQ